MKRFIRGFVVWSVRIAAVLFVLFLVFSVIFYIEEDWRGAHDWASCQREMAGKGESLDPAHFLSPETPEGDLTKEPIFVELHHEYDFSARNLAALAGNAPPQPETKNSSSIKPFDLTLGAATGQAPKLGLISKGATRSLGMANFLPIPCEFASAAPTKRR